MNPYRHKTIETIMVGSDLIIVQQVQDIESNKKHIKSGGCWVADWVGSSRDGVTADSREEVIKKMCELIERKNRIRQLQEWCDRRKLKSIMGY